MRFGVRTFATDGFEVSDVPVFDQCILQRELKIVHEIADFQGIIVL